MESLEIKYFYPKTVTNHMTAVEEVWKVSDLLAPSAGTKEKHPNKSNNPFFGN